MSDVTTHQYGSDARVPFGVGGTGANRIKIVTDWATGNLTINDEVAVFNPAKDCLVSNFVLSADDLDTNGTPLLTIDVGTAANDDLFIAASTVGQAGTTSVTNAVDESTLAGTVLTAGTKIFISIKAAAATAAAGSMTLSFDCAVL